MRILILEDGPKFYDKFQKALGRVLAAVCAAESVEYVWATSPADALQKAAGSEFDLIFSDVNMDPYQPDNQDGIDGFIKPLAGKTKTPIICMSGNPMYRKPGREAGAVEFFDKLGLDYPNCGDLELIVRRHVKKSSEP